MAQTLGQHLLLDFRGCRVDLLNDEAFLSESCVEAAKAMGATVVSVHSHRFEPHGISVMVILAESHLSLHSWPEFGMASSDIFVCGKNNDPQLAKKVLASAVEAEEAVELTVNRGAKLMGQPTSEQKVNKQQMDVAGDPKAPGSRSGRWMLDWSSPYQYTGYAVRREIIKTSSEIQDIEILETEGYGRCLILGGDLQSAEIDEYIYHECLVHPAMLSHPDPKNVLIIGGGEGATLREVLKHHTIERAVMVDCDAKVVEFAKQHLPTYSQGAFDDPRTEIIIGDGREFVRESNDVYDLVIVDINDPVEGGPSNRLFTEEFYREVRDVLGEDGVLSVQSGAACLTNLRCLATISRTLGEVFSAPQVGSFYAPFYAIEWSITLAGVRNPKMLEMTVDEVDQLIEARISGELRYYDGVGHHRMFQLPRFVRDGLAKEGPINYDREVFMEPVLGTAVNQRG